MRNGLGFVGSHEHGFAMEPPGTLRFARDLHSIPARLSFK